MTIQTIPIYYYPPLVSFHTDGSWRAVDNDLNDVDDEIVFLFPWEHDETDIETIKVKLNGTSGTGTIVCQFYTVDLTTNPVERTATTVGGSASYNWTGSDDHNVISFDLSATPPTLSLGTMYALSFKCTVDDGGAELHYHDRVHWAGAGAWPLVQVSASGGAFATQNQDMPMFTALDGSGVAYEIIGCAPVGNSGNSENQSEDDAIGRYLLDTTATSDEIGNSFTLENVNDKRTRGFVVSGYLLGNITFKLYSDPYGTPTLIDSFDFDLGFSYSGLPRNVWRFPWAAKQTLSKSTEYALTMLATDTNQSRMNVGNVTANAELDAYPGGKNFEYCHRDGSTGAFTKIDTRRLLGLSLVIDGEDSGGGGPVGHSLIIQNIGTY